jgi:hypothetical protein
VSVVDNKLSLVGIQVGWAVANTVGYVVCIMRGLLFFLLSLHKILESLANEVAS